MAHFIFCKMADVQQELLRRARAPNKNPNIAVFNRVTGEYERPNLNPNNPSAMTPVTKTPNFKENTNLPSFGSTETSKDIDHDAAETDDNLDSDKPLQESSNERSFTIRRWVPLPQSIGDKKPEPKYLADRRPGLPPLYGHRAATNTITSGATGYTPNISSTLSNPLTNTGDVVVGSVTVPADYATNASGYRVSANGTTIPLGAGTGAGAGAGAGMAAGQAQGEVPRRRPPPPPPKRKKKGGPGRAKKKVEITGPAVQRNETAAVAEVAGEQVTGIEARAAFNSMNAEAMILPSANIGEAQPGGIEKTDVVGEDVEMGEADDRSSDEDEGSEEGEIDESAIQAAVVEESQKAPDVSVQPPSPDLLGNLESEIQGMEKTAPTS